MPVPRPVLVGLALGPIVLIGAAVGIMRSEIATEVDGELAASGAVGEWVMRAPTCLSGEPLGFYGVELRDPAVPFTVRLVHEPGSEPLVSVEAQGGDGRTTALGGERCATLEVTITPTDKRLGRVSLVDGAATIDCEGLRGAVAFTSCH
ncbi:MAG: hypothetical protein R3A79_04970 [Nannocystaceae bacterium]